MMIKPRGYGFVEVVNVVKNVSYDGRPYTIYFFMDVDNKYSSTLNKVGISYYEDDEIQPILKDVVGE